MAETTEPTIAGIINFNKPERVSSARVVGAVKRLLPHGTKIGHAGALDPFATGVLVLLVGAATKQCERIMELPKQYEATLKLGATTPTDDIDSFETPVAIARRPDRTEIEHALHAFVGQIEQRPPVYSALKIGGKPAYQLARRGTQVEIKSRKVSVYGIELMGYQWPTLQLRIDCGRGTYIRAIARDLGAALGVGGYLTALCRTRVGDFHVESAVCLHQLSPRNINDHLMPPIM